MRTAYIISVGNLGARIEAGGNSRSWNSNTTKHLKGTVYEGEN
jgi:hypothetical protein